MFYITHSRCNLCTCHHVTEGTTAAGFKTVTQQYPRGQLQSLISNTFAENLANFGKTKVFSITYH